MSRKTIKYTYYKINKSSFSPTDGIKFSLLEPERQECKIVYSGWLLTREDEINKRIEDLQKRTNIRAPSSEFVSSSIPSWQILTAHAQPFRGARNLAFCLKVPLDSLLVWASSEGSGETARMRRLAWTFAARIGDKYQIRLTRSIQRVLEYH